MGRAPYLPARSVPRAHAGAVRLCALVAALAAAVLAGAASAPARDGADPPLQRRLAAALAVPHVNQARAAAVAMDLATGELLFARNTRAPLAPASTEKLAVAFAAFAVFGPVYQIPTEVLGTGGLAGTTWVGDVYLKGWGDPTLSSADLRALAGQLRTAGIRRIAGSVVGDESAFDRRRTGPGWRPTFYIGESPPLSALVVDRAKVAGRTSHDPALAAADLFRSALRGHGIVAGETRTGRAPADAYALAAVHSAPLAKIVRFMGVESDNFTAEMLLKLLGAAEGRVGTSAAGAAVVRARLAGAGVRITGVRIADGSGLSLLNRLTADALVDILRVAWADPILRGSFLSSLPISGRSGTLKRRLTRAPAVGQVFAKTGTTRQATALAGYVAGRYAFAVVHNGPPLSYWWSRRAQDRFVTVLAARR